MSQLYSVHRVPGLEVHGHAGARRSGTRYIAILAWKIFFWGAPEHETSPAGKYFPFLHVCHSHVDADEEARFDPATPISQRGHASDRKPGLEIYDTGFMRLRRRNEMIADIALPKKQYVLLLLRRGAVARRRREHRVARPATIPF